MKRLSYDDIYFYTFFLLQVILLIVHINRSNDCFMQNKKWIVLLDIIIFVLSSFSAWYYYKQKGKPIKDWRWHSILWLSYLLIISILVVYVLYHDLFSMFLG